MTLAVLIEPSHVAKCDNCGNSWFGSQLAVMRDIEQRLTANGVVPAGECPTCGALCYCLTPTHEIVVEVHRGVADVTVCPSFCSVKIIDHDSLENEEEVTKPI